jgi:hypothetical protein
MPSIVVIRTRLHGGKTSTRKKELSEAAGFLRREGRVPKAPGSRPKKSKSKSASPLVAARSASKTKKPSERRATKQQRRDMIGLGVAPTDARRCSPEEALETIATLRRRTTTATSKKGVPSEGASSNLFERACQLSNGDLSILVRRLQSELSRRKIST